MYRRIVASLLAAVLMTALAAYAQDTHGADEHDNVHYAWADVLRVDPVYAMPSTEQVKPPTALPPCPAESVEHRDSGTRGAASALLGAVLGGWFGSAFGEGKGRILSAMAGAFAGGATGHVVASSADGDGSKPTELNCHPRATSDAVAGTRVPAELDAPAMLSTLDGKPNILGYDVEYRYRGEVYMSRLNYDPGERLRVKVSVSPVE